MPVGTFKNTLYGLALPVLGKRCLWSKASGGASAEKVGRALLKRRAVGACIQRFENGRLTECITAGYAALEPEKRPVTPDTVFRTASIAKMASALLVFRLQTLGRLHVKEDISELAGYAIRNPYYPHAPITLGMLLSHTSSIVDSPAYFAAFEKKTPLEDLLRDGEAFRKTLPGAGFCYSNLAAGMVACLLERRFGVSFETLAQRELFAPLGVRATFDLSTLNARETADAYRVLPMGRAFDASARIRGAAPLCEPDPQRHYLLASGGLFLSAPELARLAAAAAAGADGFLDAQSLAQMRAPIAGWPDQAVRMRHGMGLLCLEDSRICGRALWGHQGFAYGAVNGVFFDERGCGFALLNSGCSEQRIGHLALINRDLIAQLMN
ncbi:MAG: beta-lactamase family protein [Clostridiales bacterium]|nr:beta-lactamase family protein [Clostridiales bacterium]MDO4349572.1 serine hydrolase domain-containing protein [Eubacteriales bacterium]MDY4007283.1 serine hydrolase domain-containing protein [Candidatus Limiplasma sp.]